MKHVWILNHYALEPSAAGGTHHFGLARHLPHHGWQATLIAASVEHLSGRQRLDTHELRRQESHSGVPFLWIRTPDYKGNGMRRIQNMLAYTYRVLRPFYTRGLPRPDAIIGSSVHPLAGVAGLMLARRFKVPFIFEVRDLWPQTLIDFGKLRERGAIAWAMRRLERWLYTHASRVVTLMPYAADYIESMGVPRDKVIWIPHGVELSSPATAAGETQRGPDNPFVLMYLGAHGLDNALDQLLHAMKLVAKQVTPGSMKLRLIGNGALKPDLIRLTASLGLKDVSFEDPVPKTAVPTLTAQADAFVILIRDLPKLYRYGISKNKVYDYLAAARPIVIASKVANNPVRDAGAGITVPPDDIEQLAQAILTLYQMPAAERERMGAAGRNYVETNHSFHRLAGRLASTLDDSVHEAGERQAAGTLHAG